MTMNVNRLKMQNYSNSIAGKCQRKIDTVIAVKKKKGEKESEREKSHKYKCIIRRISFNSKLIIAKI